MMQNDCLTAAETDLDSRLARLFLLGKLSGALGLLLLLLGLLRALLKLVLARLVLLAADGQNRVRSDLSRPTPLSPPP